MQAPACYLVRNAGIAGSQQTSITTLDTCFWKKMDVRRPTEIKGSFSSKPVSPWRESGVRVDSLASGAPSSSSRHRHCDSGVCVDSLASGLPSGTFSLSIRHRYRGSPARRVCRPTEIKGSNTMRKEHIDLVMEGPRESFHGCTHNSRWPPVHISVVLSEVVCRPSPVARRPPPVEMSRPFPTIASPKRGPLVEDPYPVDDDTAFQISLEDWLAAAAAEPVPAAPPPVVVPAPVNAWDDPGRMYTFNSSMSPCPCLAQLHILPYFHIK